MWPMPRRLKALLLTAFALGTGALGVGPACGGSDDAPRAAGPPVHSELLGRSVRGRAIRATRIGDGPVAVLVTSCIHGDESAGRAVINRLRASRPPAAVSLWLIDPANPDGCAARTRQNARGVDLNRNFPYRWRPLPRGTYYSGTRALSEPESQALRRFLSRVRPALSIWYHQHANLVDESGGDPRVERRYAQLVGMRFEQFARPPGSITSWQNTTYRDATAFVVELPAGSLRPAAAARHTRAVLALAAEAAR
jgi:murein peptide amidase A